jgi:hypothetical protein
MRWAGNVTRVGEMRNAYKILIGNHEGKRPLGGSRHKREDNVRVNLREIDWEWVNWIHLAQVRNQWRAVLNMVMNLRVPSKAGNFLTS